MLLLAFSLACIGLGIYCFHWTNSNYCCRYKKCNNELDGSRTEKERC